MNVHLFGKFNSACCCIWALKKLAKPSFLGKEKSAMFLTLLLLLLQLTAAQIPIFD